MRIILLQKMKIARNKDTLLTSPSTFNKMYFVTSRQVDFRTMEPWSKNHKNIRGITKCCETFQTGKLSSIFTDSNVIKKNYATIILLLLFANYLSSKQGRPPRKSEKGPYAVVERA